MQHFICHSQDLVDGGKGHSFAVHYHDRDTVGFVVRYRGKAYAYLNECAHQAMALDFKEGEFFSRDGNHLICATHGALYDPASGQCLSGRCDGRALVALAITERDEAICLHPESGIHLIPSP